MMVVVSHSFVVGYFLSFVVGYSPPNVGGVVFFHIIHIIGEFIWLVGMKIWSFKIILCFKAIQEMASATVGKDALTLNKNHFVVHTAGRKRCY